MAICGIASKRNGRPIEPPTIVSMLASLALEPDWPAASAVESLVGLGGTSPSGSVSVCNSREAIVACDAELFNAKELWAEVSGPPEGSLAELMAALYARHGLRLLEKLRGAFALAIWDKPKQKLLLAIDRFAVKSLCYSVGPADILFASQPRAIFASGRRERHVNLRGLLEYLNHTAVSAPECAFEGVVKLEPGKYVLWSPGRMESGRYWDMIYPEDLREPTGRLAAALYRQMEDSVRATSEDVPAERLGCFLSGGTDSSSVVGLVTRLRNRPANTFSIGFGEQRFNELGYAHIAARHFGSQHTEVVLGPERAFEIIPRIIEAYDEPFANSSAIPTYQCYVLARERGIRVMLAGDGGDELFGGNERYRVNQIFELYQRVPALLRNKLIEPVVFGIRAPGPIRKVRRYIEQARIPNPERYCRWLLLQHFDPASVLAPGMPFRNGHEDLLASSRAHYQAAPAHSDLNRLLYVDVKMTLGDNDLPKVVRTAELAGLQVRFPFLDHPLAEFSGRLPVRLKVRGLEKRYLFKRATRNLLPKATLKKKKHGFGLPIGLWLKNEPRLRGLAEDVLYDPRTYQRGYFRREFIEGLFHSMEQDATPFYGDVLWVFLVLELWHRRHVEGGAP